MNVFMQIGDSSISWRIVYLLFIKVNVFCIRGMILIIASAG